jgi:hypothetical protein
VQWSASFYSQSILVEEEDPYSSSAIEQSWRKQRNDDIIREAEHFNSSLLSKPDTQMGFLNNAPGEVMEILFHPFESTMVVANNSDTISVSLGEVFYIKILFILFYFFEPQVGMGLGSRAKIKQFQ